MRQLALLYFIVAAQVFADPLRVLALGDSFTIGTSSPLEQNFPSQLGAKLKAKKIEVEVRNVAVNGYSTKEVIRLELPVIETFEPNTVTLAVGANDIVRGKGVDEYRAGLKTIFAALVKSKAKVFVLPQPDWSQSPAAEAFGDRDALRARIEQYNELLKGEAKLANATYVDVWAENKQSAKDGHFAEDGLHPDPTLYTIWADRLLPLVAPK